jgi:hypothetical protein
MVTGDLVYILKDSSMFLVVLHNAGGYIESNGINSTIARNSNLVESQSPTYDDDEEENNSDDNEEQQLTTTRAALQVNIN